VGAKETWLGAVQAVRPGGRVLWFGGLPAGTQVELDGALIHYGEITLFGIYHATPGAVQTAFELIANRVVNVRALITTELPLERLEEALQMMRDGRAVKVAMIP
jgi:L-iditol 2-dehydrogenase